jgi:hypothetical protein
MCINNVTKGTRVAVHLCLADTFWRRLKGLLGTNSLPMGHGLMIKPCNSVHTFGMAYPIDVLFVDRDDRIIKIVAGMLAGRVAMAGGSHYVVELPRGTAEQTSCSIGDVLEVM